MQLLARFGDLYLVNTDMWSDTNSETSLCCSKYKHSWNTDLPIKSVTRLELSVVTNSFTEIRMRT